MFTPNAMDRYIDQSAQAFLKEQKPLNDTITKIASENGLNRDQIARVVEGANTEVYVQLKNQSSDKYVNFENADTVKIASAVHGLEKQAEIVTDDYDSDPGEVLEPIPLLEKVAEKEAPPYDRTNVHNQAMKLAGLNEQLGNSLEEIDVRFQQNSEIFYHLIKQAYLGGTSFGDIQSAITTVYDSPVVSTIVKGFQEKLAEEIDPKPLVMDVKNYGSVNSENPIIKHAGVLVKDVQEFKTLREKIAEVHKGIEACIEKFPETKHLLKISAGGAEVGALEKGLSKAKGVALTLGAGALAGGALVHHNDTFTKKQASMPMGNVAPQFAR